MTWIRITTGLLQTEIINTQHITRIRNDRSSIQIVLEDGKTVTAWHGPELESPAGRVDPRTYTLCYDVLDRLITAIDYYVKESKVIDVDSIAEEVVDRFVRIYPDTAEQLAEYGWDCAPEATE